MTNFNLEDNVTSLEDSKRLAENNIDLEPDGYWVKSTPNEKVYFQLFKSNLFHHTEIYDYELLQMAETALIEDWLSQEEDEAWEYLMKEREMNENQIYQIKNYIYWHDSNHNVPKSIRENMVASNVDPFRQGWNMSKKNEVELKGVRDETI